MPALTPDALFQRAIPLAAEDRTSLADAYGNQGEWAEDAMATRERILALKGKKLRELTAEEQKLAYQAFVFAEQWEGSLADSNPGKRVEAQCRRNVAYFRALRHHLWGKTAFESAVEAANPVAIYPMTEEDRATLERVAVKLGHK